MTIQNDFSIKDILWYRIGGTAKYYITCTSKKDILDAFEFIQKNKIAKVFVAGLGSNLLFTDEYFDGAVMQIASVDQNSIILNKEGLLETFAGVTVDDLILFSFKNNLVGLEWAGGLPGTVGGAVRGNAGAFGGETKDNIVSAEVLDYSGDVPVIKTLTKEELQFVYRGSLIKQSKKMIVLSAKFGLQKARSEELEKARTVYNKNIKYREEHHPLEYPNCGSVFKNIKDKSKIEKVLSIYPQLKESIEKKWYGKVSIAALIDLLGLKGYRVGDAKVSEKHALYIVNLGHAKESDVLSIINKIQEKFQEVFGFSLETEVEIVK